MLGGRFLLWYVARDLRRIFILPSRGAVADVRSATRHARPTSRSLPSDAGQPAGLAAIVRTMAFTTLVDVVTAGRLVGRSDVAIVDCRFQLHERRGAARVSDLPHPGRGLRRSRPRFLRREDRPERPPSTAAPDGVARDARPARHRGRTSGPRLRPGIGDVRQPSLVAPAMDGTSRRRGARWRLRGMGRRAGGAGRPAVPGGPGCDKVRRRVASRRTCSKACRTPAWSRRSTKSSRSSPGRPRPAPAARGWRPTRCEWHPTAYRTGVRLSTRAPLNAFVARSNPSTRRPGTYPVR